MKLTAFHDQLAAGLSAAAPSIATPFLFTIAERPLSPSQKEEIAQGFGPRFNIDGDTIPSGAALFGLITQTPAYYTNNDEKALITGIPIKTTSREPIITELGPGTGEKSRGFMSKFDTPFSYQAVDVSANFLNATRAQIETIDYCRDVRTVEADFYDREALLYSGIRSADMVLMLGNTLGNFSRDKASDLVGLMTAQLLDENGQIVIGLDSNHNPHTLNLAYDDPENRTSTFAQNALIAMRYDMGMNIKLDDFAYEARFIADQEMMQMGLVTRADTQIGTDEGSIDLKCGTFIEVGRSYKHSRTTMVSMMNDNGCALTHCATSPNGMSIYQFAKNGAPHAANL